MHPASHPKPIRPPRARKGPRGKQAETASVRIWVRALNQLGVGKFWRVKNTGTWDTVRKVFRKDLTTEFVAIPDICGYLHSGRAVFIEAKYKNGVEKVRKLIFSVKITDDQKKFLLEAHKRNCFAGVAFTLDDCIAIVRNDPKRYVRHPRTWLFLPNDQHERICAQYLLERKALSALRQDPVASVTFLSRPSDEPDKLKGVTTDGLLAAEEDWEKL